MRFAGFLLLDRLKNRNGNIGIDNGNKRGRRIDAAVPRGEQIKIGFSEHALAEKLR